MELDLRVVDIHSNILLLSVSGKVRAGEVAPLEREMKRLSSGPPAKLILDVHAVDSVDSSGMGTLIRGRNEIIQRGGSIVLIGVTERVSMIIKISGLADLFPVAADQTEAVQLLNAPSPAENPPAE
jgi:anti-sigma B factor antagonist